MVCIIAYLVYRDFKKGWPERAVLITMLIGWPFIFLLVREALVGVMCVAVPPPTLSRLGAHSIWYVQLATCMKSRVGEGFVTSVFDYCE